MGLRPTKIDEDAGFLRLFRISNLASIFKGVRMGLRPTKGDENFRGNHSLTVVAR